MNSFREIIDTYYQLSKNSYEKLEAITSRKEYKNKSFLTKFKNDSKKFFILTEGIVRVLVVDDQGEKRTGNLLTTPSIFTTVESIRENSFLFSIEFECLTDVTIYEGDYTKFKELSENNHEISLFHISC